MPSISENDTATTVHAFLVDRDEFLRVTAGSSIISEIPASALPIVRRLGIHTMKAEERLLLCTNCDPATVFKGALDFKGRFAATHSIRADGTQHQDLADAMAKKAFTTLPKPIPLTTHEITSGSSNKDTSHPFSKRLSISVEQMRALALKGVDNKGEERPKSQATEHCMTLPMQDAIRKFHNGYGPGELQVPSVPTLIANGQHKRKKGSTER